MDRSQLEHIIRCAAAILDTKEFVVVGSQSILGAYPRCPSDLAESMEADLYPMRDPGKSEILSAVLGELSPFHETFGIYADGVSETTATLPEQSKPVQCRQAVARTSRFTAACPALTNAPWLR